MECKDCEHYIQHYGLDNRRFFKVYCGHCAFGKAKNKDPYANTRASQ